VTLIDQLHQKHSRAVADRAQQVVDLLQGVDGATRCPADCLEAVGIGLDDARVIRDLLATQLAGDRHVADHADDGERDYQRNPEPRAECRPECRAFRRVRGASSRAPGRFEVVIGVQGTTKPDRRPGRLLEYRPNPLASLAGPVSRVRCL